MARLLIHGIVSGEETVADKYSLLRAETDDCELITGLRVDVQVKEDPNLGQYIEVMGNHQIVAELVAGNVLRLYPTMRFEYTAKRLAKKDGEGHE